MKHYFFFILIIGLPFCVNAQSSSFDNWYSLGVEYNFTKSLEAKVRIGYRMTDFDSESTFVDCILKYKFHKYVRLDLGWRYAGRGNPLDVDAITNRFHVGISTKVKLVKRLYLKARLRYQFRFKDWFVSSLGHLPKHGIRARILLNYEINKRWSLTTGGEFFTSSEYDSKPSVDPFRIINGVSYLIKKTHTLGLYYNIEHDVSTAYTAHIIALSYAVNLNKILKKKKKK